MRYRSSPPPHFTTETTPLRGDDTWLRTAKEATGDIVAISGSLRRTARIATFLRGIIAVARPAMPFTVYDGLDDLPHFAPDLTDTPITTVAARRGMLVAADGVLICTPEYAYGMPGSLKNAFE